MRQFQFGMGEGQCVLPGDWRANVVKALREAAVMIEQSASNNGVMTYALDERDELGRQYASWSFKP